MKKIPLYKGRKRSSKLRVNFVDHKSSKVKINRVEYSLIPSRNEGNTEEGLDSDDHSDHMHMDVNEPAKQPEMYDDDINSEVVSNYQSHQKKRAESWSNIRSSIIKRQVENEAHISHGLSMCIKCKVEKACVRCDDCGSNGLYCVPCFKEFHLNINTTHTPLIWKVTQYDQLPNKSVYKQVCYLNRKRIVGSRLWNLFQL